MIPPELLLKSSTEPSDGYILSFTVKSQERGWQYKHDTRAGEAGEDAGGCPARTNKEIPGHKKKKQHGYASATLPALHRFVSARANQANTLKFYIINNSEHCSSASRGISEFRGLSEPEFTQSLSQTVPVLTFALILFPARHPTGQVNNRETEIK